jgi:hypothetical protein
MERWQLPDTAFDLHRVDTELGEKNAPSVNRLLRSIPFHYCRLGSAEEALEVGVAPKLA